MRGGYGKVMVIYGDEEYILHKNLCNRMFLARIFFFFFYIEYIE